MNEYQVRFWDIKKISDTAAGRWRVRWSVAGREHHRSFRTRALAEGHLQQLKDAARAGRPFDSTTGLPAPDRVVPAIVSWYDHARAYAAHKWPRLAPKSRRSLAEALTAITVALVGGRRRAPEPQLLRTALRNYAFNPRAADPPPDIRTALGWVAKASPPVAAFTDLEFTRGVLDACSRTQTGAPAAATTVRRIRAVLHAALGHGAVLPTNPLDGEIDWQPPKIASAVDRRVVANPTQVRQLLDAVAAQGGRGRRLRAFFACLYYAALRPAEAVALYIEDCVLPDSGWGRLDLSRSEPRAGRAWTDTGQPRQTQGLKHRARDEPDRYPSHRFWLPSCAGTSPHSAPPRTGGSSQPPAGDPCKTPPTARSGKTPDGPRSAPPSAPGHSPGGPTTCATPRCRCG